MRPIRHHAKPVMTCKANKLAFDMWLAGCAPHALRTASPQSIGRSYGLDPAFVAEEIRKKLNRLDIEDRLKGTGQ